MIEKTVVIPILKKMNGSAKINIMIKSLIILFLVLGAQIMSAQQNPFSQRIAEEKALKIYEQEYPPMQSMPEPAAAKNELLFGARLLRSVTLLATSRPERRWPVKILIYGQSITGSQVFTELLAAYLKEQFPYADITLENRAIGGFNAEQIIRTSVHDVYPFYPDLTIFHVYDGEKNRELEQLFADIRRYTTSDILLLNHHLDDYNPQVDPFAYQYLRYVANKYNCELVDISTEWTKYVSDNNLKASDLLRDRIHPNRNGNALMTQLVGKHLTFNSLYPSQWQNTVQTCFVKSAYDNNFQNPLEFSGKPWEIVNNIPTGEGDKSTLKLSFYGNKVDIIKGQTPDGVKTGSARILIDGNPVTSENMVYTLTRPSAGPGTWFPAIRRVSHHKPLIAEDWTLKIEKVNADSTIWFYSVTGSKTGYDGSGNSAESFVSNSGRVVIDASDYMFSKIKAGFKVATPVGFEVHWSAVPLFKSTYSVSGNSKEAPYKTTLVQGLENGPHTLEIIPNGDGAVPIEAFEIHRPPLQ
tara:strand:+ start:56636 stop:58213 length:1578 start_codon:yes stop_codon:yes gene_type:complete